MSFLREWLLKILLWKEVKVMAVVYATLIVKGVKTLEPVSYTHMTLPTTERV